MPLVPILLAAKLKARFLVKNPSFVNLGTRLDWLIDSLSELVGDDAVNTAITEHEDAADPHEQYQLESEKGQPNGYAPLGGDGKVPPAYLPPASTGNSQQMHDLSSQADGATVVFTLPSEHSLGSLLLTRRGLTLRAAAPEAGGDFTVLSTTSVQFHSAPLLGDNVLAYYADILAESPPTMHDLSSQSNGILQDFVLPAPHVAGTLVLSRRGLVLREASVAAGGDFTVTTPSTVHFHTAPQAGDNVLAYYSEV